MPYNANSELPDSVKNVLPKHAQDIFKAAFNSAYDEYNYLDDRKSNESRDEVAFKVAWHAVKNSYEKGDDEKWHKKS